MGAERCLADSNGEDYKLVLTHCDQYPAIGAAHM
jgi:hypothetical protein